MKSYQAFIGLEVHVELATQSKMFCGCPADHFGVEQNTQTCPVCLGLPGALPVPNQKAVEWTILLGLALGCEVNRESKFDRKNYFYPDLPKGYQISQYDLPLAANGKLLIANGKEIRIRRVHLEEDTGKLLHSSQIPNYQGPADVSLVDFNRSGVPLVEIVTEPDFRTVEEVDLFLKKLQRLIRYLKISKAEMEKGSMRIEPSVSLRPLNVERSTLNADELPNYRVEIKNINSFRFARKALEYEIKRQIKLFESGQVPTQQTRGWNETRDETMAQREKEEAHDYRYFPEPDIPPMSFTESQISKLKSQIPELPEEKVARYLALGVRESDAEIIVSDWSTMEFFEAAVKISAKIEPARIASLIVNKKIDINSQSPLQLIESVQSNIAKMTMNEAQIKEISEKVIFDNPIVVGQIKSGKSTALQFLIGKVMKETRGEAEPAAVKRILEGLLI